MSAVLEINQERAASPDCVAHIRNQTVRDPSQAEIIERSAEIRQTWSETRWRKEQRHLRCRNWTVPEVRVAPSLSEAY